MRKIRAVLDTNVVVSALLHGGVNMAIADAWMRGRFLFCVTKEIIDEYARVLAYPKFKLSPEEVHRLMTRLIIPFVEPVSVGERISVVKVDPSDDKFVECAVAAKASVIVSGDKHLRDLGTYRKTKVISTKEFLTMIE
jgi:putative PIN family toxin of toxin-antitoxin system